MSDEPSNAASKGLHAAYAIFAIGRPTEEFVRASLTDDFTYQDRRSGPTFADADAESFPTYVESYWLTGASGPPRFELETLAVRGERFAAVAVHVDYDGLLLETISVVGLDATLGLLQREFDFDIDDVDGAIAELDRLHQQADAS